MSVANLVDTRYQLLVATDDQGAVFKKLNHLEKCAYPSLEKVMDEVTPTDANRTIKAPVNFIEEGEIEFSFVLDPQDEVHTALQTAFKEGKKVVCQLKITKADALNVQFDALIANLTPNLDDIKKKVRMDGRLTITSDLSPVN